MMERITIRVKRLGTRRNSPLPSYMSAQASGMDLFAHLSHEILIPPGDRRLIPTGIAVAIPEGYEGQIRPRSGLAVKYGVAIVNSPGTIDSDYRGEIKIILMNLGDEPFVVQDGVRIAQLVITPVVRAELEEVAELPETSRSEGGFGHTGSR